MYLKLLARCDYPEPEKRHYSDLHPHFKLSANHNSRLDYDPDYTITPTLTLTLTVILTLVQCSGRYGELEQQELSLMLWVRGITTKRVASD